MTFDSNIVFSKGIKKPDKTISQLNDRKCIQKLFLVAFKGENCALEIYPSLQFLQKSFSTKDLHIIGIFSSENEALEFVRKLTEISIKDGNEFDFVNAFSHYREEEE